MKRTGRLGLCKPKKRILFELLELKKKSEFQLSTCKGKKIKGLGRSWWSFQCQAWFCPCSQPDICFLDISHVYLICTLSGMQMFYFLDVTMFRMPHMTSCTPVASLIFLAFQKVEERKNSTYIFYFVKKKKKITYWSPIWGPLF